VPGVDPDPAFGVKTTTATLFKMRRREMFRQNSPAYAVVAMVFAFISGILLVAGPASAEITFTKIADTSTPIPGGAGNFTGFGIASVIDAGEVAFLGFGSAGFEGVYTSVGGPLSVVADTDTLVPGGAVEFSGFEDWLSLEAGQVAFHAMSPAFNEGIYTNVGGSLNLVADLNTPNPAGVGNFTSVFYPSISGGNVAFRASGPGDTGPNGIFTDIGGLHAVADTNTAIPGGTGNFTDFSRFPSLDGGNVAFRGSGSSGQEGIYTDIGGSLNVMLDTTTPYPGGGSMSVFGEDVSLDGTDLVFHALQPDGQTATVIGGSLNIVVDFDTPIPDGMGNFSGFLGGPSLDDGNVAFNGGQHPGDGIYSYSSGSLMKVIDITDTLDGKALSALRLDRDSLSGNQLVFGASFADGSEGVYIATVPEPASMILFMLGAGALTPLLRSRQRVSDPSRRS
jgi:hypothetical protein